MKFTVLVEDQSCSLGLEPEHGLSLYIEHKDTRYLLDSGESPLFLKNADRLGIDITEVDIAVLSHNHVDHTHGFPAFFEANDKANLYLQESCLNKPYYLRTGVRQYCGAPASVFNEYGDRLTFVRGKCRIAEGVYLLPHEYPADGSNPFRDRAERTALKCEEKGKLVYDYFRHEQSLIFIEGDEMIVFNSCSHSGIEVVIREAETAFPGKQVTAAIGGYHLTEGNMIHSSHLSDEELRSFSEELDASGVSRFITGHCTGQYAYTKMKEVLGDKLEYLEVGKTFTL